MPRYGTQRESTPFGNLLIEFMWKQRPPWTTGEMSRTLKVPRQTIANWVYRGLTPSIETIFYVLNTLDIPLAALTRAYQDAGVPMPAGAVPAADEQPQPAAPSGEEWDQLIAQTRATLQANGVSEQTIAAVVKRIEETRAGYSPIQRNIAAEHTPDPLDPPAQDYQPPKRRTQKDVTRSERAPSTSKPR